MSQGSQGAKRVRMTTATKKPNKKAKPVVVSFGKQPFPPQQKNTVKYVDYNIATMTLGFGKLVYRCNSVYDPYQTGTGHKPLYTDTLFTVYDHATVLKSRIKVTIWPNGSPACVGVVYVDDDTSTKTDAIAALEMPGATKTAMSSSISLGFLRSSWDAVKTFGGNPQSDPDMQCTSSSNPTEESFYVINLFNFGAETTGIPVLVEIEYDCVWDELKTIAQS